jgi:hypothetical protein
MKAKIFGSLLAAMLLGSCYTRNNTEQTQSLHDSTAVTGIEETENIETDTAVAYEDFDYANCARGPAESVLKKDVYPDAVFKRNPDNHTGTETLDLAGGERLIIRNWGCEYFILTFRFETERFQADTTDINFWLDKAVILMNEIERGLNTPLDIHGGTVATANHAKAVKPYRLGEEIVYDDGDVRDYVTFDRIQKMSDRRFAVEISYAKGPF